MQNTIYLLPHIQPKIVIGASPHGWKEKIAQKKYKFFAVICCKKLDNQCEICQHDEQRHDSGINERGLQS